MHLTGLEMWSALHEAQRRTMIGGQMYDVLIAVAALMGGTSWTISDYYYSSSMVTARRAMNSPTIGTFGKRLESTA